ncbi:hypothetical protein Vadar_019451 [Vaccinium darrowii]|nr:hypothetical protein Vadar_019451 [Vaccinium darrowii]
MTLNRHSCLLSLKSSASSSTASSSSFVNVKDESFDKISSSVLTIPLGGYDHGLYVEQWAPFVKELAVIVARGRDNSILCYPVVETITVNVTHMLVDLYVDFRENICHIVKAPANVPLKIRKLATDVAHKAVSSLEGARVFAVELFLTEDGQILLNEVAARPHNSGHHTIESCFSSQYEQHLRAILGLQLGDPSMKTQAAIMFNILGEDEVKYICVVKFPPFIVAIKKQARQS